jgi:NADH-quinone oxidoreductase subunit M
MLSCFLIAKFDNGLYHFQYITNFQFDTNVFNLSYCFGIDGLSILFIFLSSLLIFLTILFIWQDSLFKEYCLSLLIIEIFLYLIFTTLDLLIFYVFFEAILIPMYLVIGIWGSRQRKIRAVYLFFLYNLCGYILILL